MLNVDVETNEPVHYGARDMFMRARWSLLTLVAACSFDGGGVGPVTGDLDGGMIDPDGPDGPDGPGRPDAAGVGVTLRHDTAADFAAGAPRLDRARVEEWGAIGPEPRIVGALLARGIDQRLFDEVDEIDWDELHRQTAGGASLMTPTPLPMIDDRPVGVGITRNTQWTLWLEGEVFLEAGRHTWRLDVDDDGAIDLAPPGTAAFERVVDADSNRDGQNVYPAATTGWYPIRIAVSQGGGESRLVIETQGPGDTAPVPLPAYRLRTVAPTQTGLLAQGFDDRRMLDARGVNLMRGTVSSVSISKPVASAGKDFTNRRDITRYPESMSRTRSPKITATVRVSSLLPSLWPGR
jgi:hypothetical protein